MEPLITMHDVSKCFGNIKAIDNASIDILRGEIIGFLGPNGSGKTTTVRLLNGVIFPDEGSINIKGLDSVKDGEKIRKFSGVLTETASLYENMTAEGNLKFFAEIYNVPEEKAEKRIGELLEQFKLTDRRKQKVGNLSTGLKKRLGIAKALIHDPDILYLDEPTSGLDPEASRDLIDYIKQLNGERLTVFVCTHNLAEAEHFCTRFVFLDKGRIIESGTLSELEEKYSGVIKLKVDYRGNIKDAVPQGIDFEDMPGELNCNSALLTIPSKKQVPSVIRTLSSKADIFCVQPANSGLEALYFEIRRNVR